MGKSGGGKRGKPGPKEDTLRLDGLWEAAVGKALKKRRPKGGFPTRKTKQRKQRN
jgi:hypothetical protein